MFVRRNRGRREAWQFIHEQVRFVDQDGQALWAEVLRLAFEGQVQQGDFLFGAVAIQANMFGHGFSIR